MKRLLFMLTILVLTLTATAQEYTVYRIRGNATLVVKQNATPLQKKQKLNAADIVSLDNRAELKLLQMDTQEMITLRGQCAGSLLTLIDQQQGSRQKMTAQYMQFVMQNLRGEGYNESMQAGKSTTIYRTDGDSLFIPGPDEYYFDYEGLADSIAVVPPAPDSIHFPVLVLRPSLFAVSTERIVPKPRPRLRGMRIKRINITPAQYGKKKKK